MSGSDCLEIRLFYPVEAVNAGLFVSTGNGIHDTRVLDTYELVFVNRGELHLFEEVRDVIAQAADLGGRRRVGLEMFLGEQPGALVGDLDLTTLRKKRAEWNPVYGLPYRYPSAYKRLRGNATGAAKP